MTLSSETVDLLLVPDEAVAAVPLAAEGLHGAALLPLDELLLAETRVLLG